jgi:hypothetical protein
LLTVAHKFTACGDVGARLMFDRILAKVKEVAVYALDERDRIFGLCVCV